MKTAVWLLAGAAALSACAPSRAPQDVAARVSGRVMSPFCPGVTLHDCPSQQADELRLEIQTWAEEGLSEDAIMTRLERDYGPQINAAPPARGAGWLAWLLPGLALAAGAALAWQVLARFSTPRSAPAVPDATPEERRRLQAELQQVRREL